MSLVFAAVTPHPPLLIPSIGKEKTALAEKTQRAFERLEEDLYIAKPNLIAIISPHASLFPDAFTVNGHDTFSTGFQEFGDFVTKQTWRGAPEFATRLSHRAKEAHISVQTVSEEALDHGAAVPLFFLTRHQTNTRILPLGYSNQSRDDHVRMGALLKETAADTGIRLCIIASGDLSHTGGAHPFDDALRSALEKNDLHALLSIPEELAQEAKECGYRSILIAMGAIGHMHAAFETYSYETPVGIGYLVGNFHL